MLPHTRRGHYRKYKNGKTAYVKAAIIHKEKYEGIQSAHRMNQSGGKNRLEQEAGEAALTGMRRNLRCGTDFGPGTLQRGVITFGKDAAGCKEVDETTRRE